MSNEVEIRVPDIGDFTDIPIVEVLVKEGQSVDAEQSLVTLESDKAVMEIPAPAAGTVMSLGVAEGDLVSEGALVAVLTDESQRKQHRPPLNRSLLNQNRNRGGRSRQPLSRKPLLLKTRSTPPIMNMMCWCWAPARVVTPRLSVPPTSV